MFTHLYRPINYLPSPVTSVTSNSKTVVAFRRNGMCEFIHSLSLQKFLSFELKEVVIQSFFLDLNLIVCLTVTHKIILFDISTLSVEVLNVEASNLSVEFNNVKHSNRSFYFSSLRNEIFFYNNGKSTLVSTMKSTVTALLSLGNSLILGTSDGWLTILVNGSLATEIEIKATPTCIRSIDINTFIVTAQNGWVYLFNPISEIVLDKIQIREHSLNSMAVVGSNVHVSGVDSRISLLKINNNKILKSYQGDIHTSEVLTMCSDNERAISAGEDCLVVFITSLPDKYSFRPVFDSSLLTGQSNEFFFTAYNKSLNLLKLEGSYKETVDMESSLDDLVTFKIDNLILQQINQKQSIFKNFYKISMPEEIISAAINSSFVCISTSTKTYLYSLENSQVNKIQCFIPAKWIGMNSSHVVLQGLDKTITIIDLSNMATFVFNYDQFEENVQFSNGIVYLPYQKIAYEINGNKKINFELGTETIVASSSNESQVYFVGEEERGLTVYTVKSPSEILKNEIDCKVNLSAKHDYSFKDITHCSGAFNSLVCANEKYFFIIEDKKVSTYEIGNVIQGIAKVNEDIVIIQSQYKKLTNNYKKSVFKPKYQNK